MDHNHYTIVKICTFDSNKIIAYLIWARKKPFSTVKCILHIMYLNLLLSWIGWETTGGTILVILPFSSGRKTWKHSLTTLRSMLFAFCMCLKPPTTNKKQVLNQYKYLLPPFKVQAVYNGKTWLSTFYVIWRIYTQIFNQCIIFCVYWFIYINIIYIHRNLEDCATIPIKMFQKIYWQNFRSTNDLPQCLSKLDWVCKD